MNLPRIFNTKKTTKDITVLLDNGHGIECANGSPKWPDGTMLKEYEFARNIVRRVAQILEHKGIKYKILVPEEHDVPLQERSRRANNFYAQNKNCFGVSFHSNAGGGTGYEVWTSTGRTKSDDIATIFWQEMKKEFPDQKMRIDMTDGDIDKEKNFHILYYTKMPFILTENFFHDNYSDCKMMMSEQGRQRIAEASARAIERVINELY